MCLQTPDYKPKSLNSPWIDLSFDTMTQWEQRGKNRHLRAILKSHWRSRYLVSHVLYLSFDLQKSGLVDWCGMENVIQLLPKIGYENEIVQMKQNSAGYQEFSMHEFYNNS